MQAIFVWDALIAWRDSVLKKDVFRKSKTGYLSHMSRLIDNEIVDLEQPLEEFIRNGFEKKLQMIDKTEWATSTKQARSVVLRAFYRFSKQKHVKPANSVIPFKEFRDLKKVAISELLSSNEDKAKSQCLKPSDIVRFLSEMCLINPRDALICWLMWELKSTVHQILDLAVGDVDLHKGIINLKTEFRLGNIRPDMQRRILEQSKGKSAMDLLFTTDKGNRIHSGQISRSMKIASKNAKLPIIMSPKILYADAKAYGEKAFLAMSTVERKQVFKGYEDKMALLRKSEKISLQK